MTLGMSCNENNFDTENTVDSSFFLLIKLEKSLLQKRKINFNIAMLLFSYRNPPLSVSWDTSSVPVVIARIRGPMGYY
jgi:hypothetical protein